MKPMYAHEMRGERIGGGRGNAKGRPGTLQTLSHTGAYTPSLPLSLTHSPTHIHAQPQVKMTQLTLEQGWTLTMDVGATIVLTPEAPQDPCPSIDDFDVSDESATSFDVMWSPANNGGQLNIESEQGMDRTLMVSGTSWKGTVELDGSEETTFTLLVPGTGSASNITARKTATVPRRAPGIVQVH